MLAVVGLAGAATWTVSIAQAASNPSDTVAVSCPTPIGTQNQDITFRATGPDQATSGAAVTMTLEATTTAPFPASQSGVTINGYRDMRTIVTITGATIDGVSVTPGSGYEGTATATVDGSTVTVTVPGPIAPGTAVTTPAVAISTTVTAANGGVTGLQPASPFYSITADAQGFGAQTVNCTADNPSQGTLSIPVSGADTSGPNITVSAPYSGAIYGYQQVVLAAYSCADASGVATCAGSVPVGSPIDTGTQGPHTFTVEATDSQGNASSRTIDYLVLPPGVDPPAPPTYTAMNPARLLDTRPGGSTADGDSAGLGATAAGQTIELHVAGRAGVPADAVAAVLNITATDTSGWGYASVFPCGETRPNASNLNYTEAGDTRPNAVVTKLGTDGKVCIFTGEAGAHLIADVNGFFPPGAAFESLNPGRLLDSRGGETVDGQSVGGGQTTAGQTIELAVGGRHGVPADAEAVVLNLTATDTLGWGYVTAHPCDESRPTASNVNYTDAGQTTPNLVVTKLSASGTVCLYVGEAGSHLLADVAGYFPAGSGYTPINPARMLDTRSGGSTVDGVGVDLGVLAPGSTVRLPVAFRAGVPGDALAAVLNVTATATEGWGYVSAFPCGAERPNASNVNFTAAGQTRPNAVFSQLGEEGRVCLYVGEAATHLIVDVAGYFPAPEGVVVPPFDPPPPPPTTEPPTTQPGDTTTTTTLPPGAEAPAECAPFLTQVVAQLTYTILLLLNPAAAAALDPNGNGVACEDYPYLI